MKYPLSSAITLFLCASSAMGAAMPGTDQHGVERSFGPDLGREYTPSYLQSTDAFGPSTTSLDPQQVAIEFASAQLTDGEFAVKTVYTSDLSGVTHVYLRQLVNGLPVVNGDININVKDGRVFSFGNSFAKQRSQIKVYGQPSSLFGKIQNGLDVISSTVTQIVFGAKGLHEDNTGPSYAFANHGKEPAVSPSDALVSLLAFVKHSLPDPSIVQHLSPDTFTAVEKLQGDQVVIEFADVPFALSPIQVTPAYIALASGELQMVWDLQMELEDNWYNGHVNAHDGTVVSLNDWVSHAAYYNVIPFGANDPSDSDQVLVKNPHDTWASPEGWHAQGALSTGHATTFNVTAGNNVYAHTNPDGGYNWENNYRPSGKTSTTGHETDIVFDYNADFVGEEPDSYEDAAVTNLFYWCNTAHDLFHRYGFDEKAGNFQQDNLGRGRGQDEGAGDAVVANAQDGSGRNNANFATPPDGKHGKMRMYVWDQTKPMRDGDFESGIIIHEYTHGVSNRLTGGPHNSNCLGWGEAGGMGEGWGDFVATIIRMKPTYTRDVDFDMGSWANGGQGIRKYIYSTSNTTNPSTYKIMDRFDYWGVHAKGEVWAEMLYEVYWNLVDRHGFTSDWLPPVPTDKDERGLPLMTPDVQDQIRQHILSHGNTLALQLVLDGMKLQPCTPSFLNARDAILDADKALTGGDNFCDIYAAFAKRGLGHGAKLAKEGWIEKRVESYTVPPRCRS